MRSDKETFCINFEYDPADKILIMGCDLSYDGQQYSVALGGASMSIVQTSGDNRAKGSIDIDIADIVIKAIALLRENSGKG